MIQLEKINDMVVKPIKLTVIDKSDIQGSELFGDLLCNIFVLAKKKSGKTNTIFNILKKCSNRNTKVIIFASTVKKDANWIATVEWLKKHKIEVVTKRSIFEDGINHIELLTDELGDVPEEESKPKNQKQHQVLRHDNFEEKEAKEYKPKLKAPEYILVFDDLSIELHDKYITKLVKEHRHYGMKVIISSQHYNDLAPDARMQMDYMLMFPNIPDLKIEQTFEDLDLSVPYEVFYACYKDATKDKYNFLYVDVRNDRLRKNFNLEYKNI